MLQLQNNTPFATNMALFPNEDAIDTLYVLAKATFKIGKNWTLAEEQAPLIVGDEYWTEPDKSSIKYASDFHTGKPCSDIIMLGHACAPEGKLVKSLDVGLSVGQVSKTIRVFGDRHWQDGKMTSPKPFKTMPLVYEKAYGGAYIKDGQIVDIEQRNPVGRGFAGQRNVGEMNGVPLPNLEDPNYLIADINDTPLPACFGISAPHWMPRSQYAGTYDETWQTSRAPYLPEDFDKRFFSMAHPDLVYPGYLQGGESVVITNMHPRGKIVFTVPKVNLVTDITVAAEVQKPRFSLETLILEPNKLLLSMVWRAAMQCDKQALKVEKVRVSTTR
jgi:hypothetical protein